MLLLKLNDFWTALRAITQLVKSLDHSHMIDTLLYMTSQGMSVINCAEAQAIDMSPERHCAVELEKQPFMMK